MVFAQKTMTITNCLTFAATVAIITLATASASIGSEADQLPRGEVIERVTCKADQQQSYSLFLPSRYTPDKKWPILYAFDPRARGKLPVNLFKEAAEKFGFIVAGSNNSRNGVQVSPMIAALWDDTHARFSIDERRIYAAGFSGGARVASAVGFTYPGVAGVIACSGGFPSGISSSPSVSFVLFATTGTEDFNFPEMEQLKRKLDAAGVANRLAVFEGGHDWAPAELCGDAIAWLEIQAIKTGRRAKDDALIDQLFDAQAKEALALETAQKSYEAYGAYEALAEEFRGLREVKEFEANIERLKALKEIKAAIKDEKAQEEKQENLTAKFQNLIRQLQDRSTYPQTIAELRLAIADLAKQAEEKQDPSRRQVARRVLQLLLVQTYEEANALYQQKNYALIPGKFEIAAELKPKDAQVFYNLAVAYARIGNKTRAMAALSRSIENGFTDLAEIEQNQDFAALRNEAAYERLVAELKKRK
jgi:dienelactone hydrolase